MKKKQKYFFVDRLNLQQLLQLDGMRTKILVCTGESEKPFGFLIKLTPQTISFLKSHRLITSL